ncbi:PREDICTED: WAT1-related protein At1g60050 [Tarenaya hassleriana]|uniref:WAT1-related protein At1g60050 n=1 Tax=Tarenaya hassleriana TaxID=28532 RepID=UPI00053C5E57|nr:PREDICTED: WAT1-related protein At1g60050 [Tarenaya hassleriana]
MRSMDGRMEDTVPFGAMVLMEASTIALTILAKTALTGGMSPFVFVVYTNALGSLLLVPYSFLFHQHERTDRTFFTLNFIICTLLLGFTGVFLFQNLAFMGLSYSSPIVVCAMGLQTPALSYLLSLALGKAKLEWERTTTRGKVIGTLVSLTGAMVEVIYLGPYTRPSPSSSPNSLLSRHLVFFKNSDNWVLGCFLLACASLSVSAWNFIQVDTVRKYPQVMKVVAAYSLAGTVQCSIFSAIMESDLNAWKLKPNMDLMLIIATGIFGSIIRTSVHVKCAKLKGPYYVPLFKPFGILWATIFGTSFFVNSLHYGSVLGATVAGIGYLMIMWGQVHEEEDKNHMNQKGEIINNTQETVPLLRENDAVDGHV